MLAAIAGYFYDAKTVISESLGRKAIAAEEKSGEAKAHRT